MSYTQHRVAELERQVTELRAELAALRDGLADAIHTRRIVVTDYEKETTITPAHVEARNEHTGLVASIWVDGAMATVRASSAAPGIDYFCAEGHYAELIAVIEDDLGPGSACVEVDGVELRVPQPAKAS